MEGRSSAAPQVWYVDFNLPSSMPCEPGHDSTEARRDQAPQASVWLLAAGQQILFVSNIQQNRSAASPGVL